MLQQQPSRKRRLPKPPIDQFPVTIERDFRTFILRFFEQIRQTVRDQLVPELPALERLAEPPRSDSYIDQADWVAVLNRVFGGIAARQEAIGKGFDAPEQFTEEIARETARDNLRKIRRQVKTVFGLDIFVNDTRLAGLVESFALDNARLIKDVPEKFVREVQRVTVSALRGGRRAESLTKTITGLLNEEEDKARRRAALIARDQLASLRADITRDRQTQLGVKCYKWRTAGDERVRPEHAAREGKIFKWTDPPPDGHPGQPILCRCTAEPVLDDLV